MQWGSSPLTRGKPDEDRVFGEYNGLIPAHAGKTDEANTDSEGDEAHPRSRGENSSDATPAKDSVGSSPLTRGKLIPRPAALALCGLIPAHAGKTLLESKLELLKRAHPRSRGENTS